MVASLTTVALSLLESPSYRASPSNTWVCEIVEYLWWQEVLWLSSLLFFALSCLYHEINFAHGETKSWKAWPLWPVGLVLEMTKKKAKVKPPAPWKTPPQWLFERAQILGLDLLGPAVRPFAPIFYLQIYLNVLPIKDISHWIYHGHNRFSHIRCHHPPRQGLFLLA